MAVNGTITNENGDAILISLQEPYSNTVEVVGYEDVVEGETEEVSFNRSFRWGIDGVTYSDWAPLSSENLQKILLDPANSFWIQYKYEQVGDGELEFKSVSLELVTDNGVICKVPQINCCDSGLMTGAQNLVIDCCGSTWNPYDLSRASQLYNQLSAVTSNIFGFCVKYFKTAADQRSRDVILKEYSLFNVISTGEVKILIPDNQLPTREIQFNSLMMDYPVQFEIHIVKSAFEAVFGVGAKPEMRDYLYFEQYMNRMYEIDAIAEADDFLYSGSYWRVSLVTYQQRTAVLYPDKNIEAEKDELVSNVEEKFKEERNNEFDDVRKPNQYNTIGNLSNDYVRRILDKRLLIKEENVYNNWTVISKYNYQLETLNTGTEAVNYKYNQGWDSTDDRSFTFWIRPKYPKAIGVNVAILSIIDNGGKVKFEVNGELPRLSEKINVGDWVSVTGTASYNGIHKVIAMDSTSIDIDTDYINSTFQGTPKFNKEASNAFMIYQTQNFERVSFVHTQNWFIIKINSVYFKYNLKLANVSLLKDSWYGIVINLNSLAKQLSLFVYTLVENSNKINPNNSSILERLFIETKDYEPTNVPNLGEWRLLGCKMDLTNIRIWKKPIEEELQSLILSQYVVKDTFLTLLLDNASPRLLLDKTTNPR